MTLGGQHATRCHSFRRHPPRLQVLDLAVAGQRVHVEVPVAAQRDAGQHGVVERPLDEVGVARLPRGQQHAPAPHDAGDRATRLAVGQVVRQVVGLPERLGEVAGADPAGDVELAADHVVPLPGQRLQECRLARLEIKVGDAGRRGTTRGRRDPRPRRPLAPARDPEVGLRPRAGDGRIAGRGDCHGTERCGGEEHAAPGAQRSGRVRQLRGGHGHPARPRRPARAVAGPRVGAEELHRRGRERPAEALGHRPDRPAPRRHALQQPGPRGRSPRGPVPDGPRGHEAGRRRVLRRGRPGPARAPSRSSTPPGPTPAACTICGSSTAPTCTWPAARRTSSPATRRTTSSTASSTSGNRPSRSRSVAGGCPGRATATPSRRRPATRSSTPGSAPTTRTSTPAGPTGPGSATSTAARSSSTSRTWRTRRC